MTPEGIHFTRRTIFTPAYTLTVFPQTEEDPQTYWVYGGAVPVPVWIEARILGQMECIQCGRGE